MGLNGPPRAGLVVVLIPSHQGGHGLAHRRVIPFRELFSLTPASHAPMTGLVKNTPGPLSLDMV